MPPTEPPHRKVHLLNPGDVFVTRDLKPTHILVVLSARRYLIQEEYKCWELVDFDEGETYYLHKDVWDFVG